MKYTVALIAATLLSVSFAHAANRLFGFDASDLPHGDVSPSDIEKAARSQGNPSQQSLSIHAKSPSRLEVLANDKSVQFLRVHLPESQEESKSTYVSFRDSKLVEYIDPSQPISLEYKIQSSSDRNSIYADVVFLRGDKFHAVCMFRTPKDQQKRLEAMFDLHANEPTTITITLSVQDGSIVANVKAKSESGLSDEKEWTLPKTENLTLADIQVLSLIATPEEGAPNAHLDLFSVSISQ
jgi:hypothetical protein